jgi:hypothetical protein
MLVVKSAALPEALPAVADFLGLPELPPDFSRTRGPTLQDEVSGDSGAEGPGGAQPEDLLRVRLPRARARSPPLLSALFSELKQLPDQGLVVYFSPECGVNSILVAHPLLSPLSVAIHLTAH